METALSPESIMEHALESNSFIYDFIVGLRKLEQILRNMKLIAYGGLNGNIEALVSPLFLSFEECASMMLLCSGPF